MTKIIAINCSPRSAWNTAALVRVAAKVLKKLGFSYAGDVFYKPTGLNHPSYLLKGSLQHRLSPETEGCMATDKTIKNLSR